VGQVGTALNPHKRLPGDKVMANEIIPWHVFLEALKQRPRARIGEWLARWRFTDEGAFAQMDLLQPATDPRYGSEPAMLELNSPMPDYRILH
jgi:hypothetical protein